ncbi:MAG: threonine synthase [Opitutales bacterium]|nr:threonine synthase [Opitutales bacterium]MCH8541315.1 threonine synthase [Opitutales bacterium]
MKYQSTRGQSPAVSFSEAVAIGLAPDGGLYLPAQLPDLSEFLPQWEKLSYPELCASFFGLFDQELSSAEWLDLAQRSYSGFAHPEIAPMRQLDEQTRVLELFHGPTLAFKDFALQLLGNLYEKQIARTGTPINVLGATSGDTGAAAIHGLLEKEGVSVFILYPNGRVSPLQERQMTRTEADNVFPLAIEGNFDDAQKALKEVFGDQEFRTQVALSAVNSINIARVLAQAVYYLYAWFRLPVKEREQTRFVVPSGNFGNVLAGWMLGRMGVPMGGFQVATNQNDILYRFFSTGRYQVDQVRPSLAPSMDIQVASNFERFLYYALGEDPVQVREVMHGIKNKGSFVWEDFKNSYFTVSRTDDDEIGQIIAHVYREYDYVVDPHTACGFAGLSDPKVASEKKVIVSTAHPAKFPQTIEKAIGLSPTHPFLEELATHKEQKFPLQAHAEDIRQFILSHGQKK